MIEADALRHTAEVHLAHQNAVLAKRPFEEFMQPTQFINVVSTVPLVAPKVLKAELAISPATTKTVLEGRATIQKILAGEDSRVLVVVGPCSIHDPKSAVEYASRLKALADKVSERMLVVMITNSAS